MALSHSPRIVTSGLVLCLDSANIKSYPGSGTTWSDLSGNGNNGTLTNGPIFVSSNSGSIQFDGIDDLTNIAGSSSADFGPSTSEFTIDIWYKSNVSSSRGIASALYDRYRYYVYHEYNNNTSYMNYVKKEWESTSIFTVNALAISGLNPKGSWNNVTFTYTKISENGTITGYSNGVLSGSSTASRMSSYPLATHYLGNSNHSGINYYAFDGNISVVKVYNRALSANEIAQNFNALRGRYNI